MHKLFHCELTILFLIFLLKSYGQPACSFEHFAISDGLPQFTINDIIQDNKGFIWMATYDGLSKFDGYEFHNYKAKVGDSIQMKSNRIDLIYVDKYNRIWMEKNGDEAHCFDPKTGKFWGLESWDENGSEPFSLSKIQVKPSGKVWLLSQQAGCVCILDSLFHTKRFNEKEHNISGLTVNSVHEDKHGDSWLLTDNGLTHMSGGKTDSVEYFFSTQVGEKEQFGFYSVLELENEIWFGTDNGKIVRYIESNKSFLTLEVQVSSPINYMYQLDSQTLFIATLDDGFFTYNLRTRQFQTYNNRNTTNFDTRNLSIVYITKANKVWFSNNKLGIYQLDLSTRKLDFYFVKTDDVSIASFPPTAFILTDKRNQLWVHPTGGGFSFYDETTNQLKPFYNTPFSENAKFSNMLHSGYFDRQGILWMGTRSHGLEKIVFNKNYFSFQKVEPNSNTLFGNNIRAVFEDRDRNVWISSKDNKLYIYNANLYRKTCLSPEGKTVAEAIWPNTIYCIFRDSNNNIWLGTRGSGVYKCIPKGNSLEFKIEHYSHDENDLFSLSNNNIYSIFEDKHHRIWFATLGGGLNLLEPKPDNARFIHPNNLLANYPKELCSKVRYITEDRNGHICLGTTDGLLMFSSNFESPENIDYKLFRRQPGNAHSISNNDIIDIQITQKGEMFLATSGGGLNKVTAHTNEGYPEAFKSFSRDDGMPSDLVESITEDFSGKLWIGTESSLCRFNPATESFEVFSEVGRLLNGNSFSEATRCIRKSGEIMLGYSEGVLSFFPEDIKTNNFIPHLSFLNLQIFNKKVPINRNSPIQVDIDDCPVLVLNHKQNFFSIEYAALDLVNPRNIQYAYILEGFDKDWNYVQTKRIANYTKIPKGQYIFRVKSTNSEGVWVSNERTLPITIMPAFWETPIAYAIYILVFVLIFFLVNYSLLTIFRLKSKVALEKKMSEMKQKFFIDISHEIRTPLTMITAPVEYMLNDHRTPEPMKKQLAFISQSSNRMLRLVNQILDLRKLQDSTLNIKELDPGLIAYEIFNSFSEIAKENEIEIHFKNQAPNEKIWANRDSLEKIMMNLLSNSFKYTAKGKSITVKLTSDNKYVTISVIDEGSGISKEKQKKIFIRFMSFNDDPSKPSTGIGLALIKELADKHSAKITVESEIGTGSCFSISFLKGNSHFLNNSEVIVQSEQSRSDEEESDETDEPKITPPSDAKGEQKIVLIVEDDADLRSFIFSILEEEYIVLEAVDGVQGYTFALERHPDFIISDIMMPNMDGIELLKKLREDVNTSHIPIILLTAKTNIESKLEGLTYGVDDYITKPFSIPYFKARIVNLINQRKRLQEVFGKANSIKLKEYNPHSFLISPHDEEIMKKVMYIIEQNIDKVDFTIEELAATIGINRTSFQNKIKSLTGLSPVEFVRDIRLKRAAQLVTDSNLLIKEISYITGFTDTKYFGKCFKAKYGVTPLEYRNREK